MEPIPRSQQPQRKEYLKQYREANKERLAEKDHAKYIKNKEAILAQKSQKFQCEICGGKYTHRHKNTHEKTLMHQQAVSATTSGSSSSSPGAS